MELYISSYELKSKYYSLTTYINNINKYTQLNKLQDRIKKDMRIISRLISDITIFCDSCDINSYILDKDLKMLQEANNIAQSLDDVFEIKKRLITNLLEQFYLDKYMFKSHELNMKANKYRYYNDSTVISFLDLKEIASSIRPEKSRRLKIFDPCCANGRNLEDLGSLLKADTYGLESEDYGYTYEFKTKFTRCIKGNIKGSRISNGVFDVMLLSPRPTMEVKRNANNDGLKDSNEKFTLVNSIRFARDGGIIIYKIPFTRLSEEINIQIAKNLINIGAYKLEEFYDDNSVLVIGKKKVSHLHYAENIEMLRSLQYDSLPILGKSEINEYIIPGEDKEVELFRGNELDTDEIQLLIDTDGLYEDFFASTSAINNKTDKAPLLPFNMGQIGLVLTSGQLDGVVQESEDVFHIVKGQTIKVTETKKEEKDNDTTLVTEITSNRVQINAITADGTFIELI